MSHVHISLPVSGNVHKQMAEMTVFEWRCKVEVKCHWCMCVCVCVKVHCI